MQSNGAIFKDKTLLDIFPNAKTVAGHKLDTLNCTKPEV